MQIPSSPAVGGNSKNTFFFDNRARAALRHDLMAAIIDDTPLIVLTGPKGSGKTALLSQFVSTLPNGLESLGISQTSHGGRRFDDVLLRICRHIALEPAWSGHPDAGQIRHIQEEIRHYLTRHGTRLLLILDQEEETFLAMLERVLKMLDAVNDGAVIMHLLLIGQENLPADLKRLRLAHVPETPERHFTLPLLDDSMLPDFLRQWLAQARPDIQENTISLRGWQTLCAEAGGRPGHLTALLEERIDILTLTGGQTERRPDVPNKTGKTRPPMARQGKKMFAGFSLTTMAKRLEDALLTPPRRHPQHPATGKQGRAASRAISRRLVSPTRLRRKNILFWGRLYRHAQMLRKRLAPTMAAIAHAASPAIKKAGRGISRTAKTLFSAAANRTTLGKMIAAKIPALPPGVLKKFVILLVAVWLAVVGVAALWQSFSHVSSTEKNKQDETQTLAEKASQPVANLGEEDILPGGKPAGQAQPEGQEIISGPAAGMATAAAAATAIAPKAAAKAASRPAAATKAEKKLERPVHTREAVKITPGKKKKKAAPAASKPTHIPRGKTIEKARR